MLLQATYPRPNSRRFYRFCHRWLQWVLGMGSTIAEAFQTVRKGGEVAVIGFTLDSAQMKAGAFMGLQKRIGGSWGCPTRLFPEVIELLEADAVPLDVLVSRVYALDEIQTAFDDLHSGKVIGRAVIEIPQV